MKHSLIDYYSDTGRERCGFILNSGEVIEVENFSEDEDDGGFFVSTEDLLKYENLVVSSWHTHPGSPSNLTVEDEVSFKAWPKWSHFVIGSDGISLYQVKDGVVVSS